MDDNQLLQRIYDIVLTESTDEATDQLFALFKEQQAKKVVSSGRECDCEHHGMGFTQIAAELGKRGGQATKAKHGKTHYQKLAENMNRKRAARKACRLRDLDKWCWTHSRYH